METLKAYATLIKFVAFAAIVAFLCWMTWKAASDHYGKIISDMQLAHQTAVANEQAKRLAEAAAHQKAINDAGEQHDKDQLRINQLTAELGSVHLHFPASRGGLSKAGNKTGSNGNCGLAASRADEYLAEAQQAINLIGQRCAQLNADAIQANAVNK